MREVKKIMVVDDDPAILDSIGMILEFEGYQVLVSTNSSSLLTIENELPDLVLLDIWMSGTDGRDICKYLKKKPSTKDIPILLISASREIEKSAKEAGANDFLSKPFEVTDLLAKVEKHIQRHI
jgi:DNA-binding response OmpR family regulator